MAVAFVQATASAENTGGATSQSVTFGSTTTSGHLVVVCSSIFDSDGTPPTTFTITDNKGNNANYANARGQTYATNGRIEQAYCPNIIGGASHQVTVSFGDTVLSTVGILAFSGAAATSPVTGTPTSNTGTGTAVTSGSVTPGNNGIFVAQMSYENLTPTITPNWSGATQRLEIDENDDASANSILTKAATASSADNAAWTLSGSAQWAGLLVAYKEAAGSTFNDSVTEAATASDTVASANTALNTRSEAGSAADSLAHTALVGNGLTEAGTASDTGVNTAILVDGTSESVSASDAVSDQANTSYNESVSESGSASDALANVGTLLNTATESAAASDATNTNGTYNTALTEAGTANDSLTDEVPGPAGTGGGDIIQRRRKLVR